MNKLSWLLPFFLLSITHAKVGLYAEGPTPINYGIFYSSGIFVLKNGYSYSNTTTEAKNDTATVSESGSSSFGIEVSPGLILRTGFLDFEFCPVYRLTMGGNSYDAKLGNKYHSESSAYLHSLKFNFLFSKEFDSRYRLGVGSTLINYSFGNTKSEIDPENPAQATTNTKSGTSSFSEGVSFYLAISAAFF